MAAGEKVDDEYDDDAGVGEWRFDVDKVPTVHIVSCHVVLLHTTPRVSPHCARMSVSKDFQRFPSKHL